MYIYIYIYKLFCLLGPNGAGKTTTINMLTGKDRQDGASVGRIGRRLAG